MPELDGPSIAEVNAEFTDVRERVLQMQLPRIDVMYDYQMKTECCDMRAPRDSVRRSGGDGSTDCRECGAPAVWEGVDSPPMFWSAISDQDTGASLSHVLGPFGMSTAAFASALQEVFSAVIAAIMDGGTVSVVVPKDVPRPLVPSGQRVLSMDCSDELTEEEARMVSGVEAEGA